MVICQAMMLLAMKTQHVIGAFRSIYCHSKTNLSQKQIPDDYFEYNSAYVRKRQAYSVRTIESTKWMHTEWHKSLLLVIGLSQPSSLFVDKDVFPTFPEEPTMDWSFGCLESDSPGSTALLKTDFLLEKRFDKLSFDSGSNGCQILPFN